MNCAGGEITLGKAAERQSQADWTLEEVQEFFRQVEGRRWETWASQLEARYRDLNVNACHAKWLKYK